MPKVPQYDVPARDRRGLRLVSLPRPLSQKRTLTLFCPFHSCHNSSEAQHDRHKGIAVLIKTIRAIDDEESSAKKDRERKDKSLSCIDGTIVHAPIVIANESVMTKKQLKQARKSA